MPNLVGDPAFDLIVTPSGWQHKQNFGCIHQARKRYGEAAAVSAALEKTARKRAAALKEAITKKGAVKKAAKMKTAQVATPAEATAQ
jgi:hypothetical protein